MQKHRGRATGPRNGKWVGDKIGYVGVHSWIRRKLGEPLFCQYPDCDRVGEPAGFKKSYFEWANISGYYLRDFDDWLRLCTLCHQRFDRKAHRERAKGRNNTSGYRGVSWEKLRRKWCASVERKGKHFNLGRYDTKEEAVNALNAFLTKEEYGG